MAYASAVYKLTGIGFLDPIYGVASVALAINSTGTVTGDGEPIVDAIQPMPFPAMQSLLGPSFPDGNQNYWKSTCSGNLRMTRSQ